MRIIANRESRIAAQTNRKVRLEWRAEGKSLRRLERMSLFGMWQCCAGCRRSLRRKHGERVF